VTAAGCAAPTLEQHLVPVHDFSNGLLNPILAYAMSCLGAFLGLRCAAKARAHTGFGGANWLILAAVSFGAAANWTMHFIAMLGLTIPGQQILYNVPRTIASMLVAIVVVGTGLFIVGYGSGGRARLVTGGVIAGIGIACMHYMGEAAMVMPDSVRYNTLLVILSVIIALLAGTAVLWASGQVLGIGATIVASLALAALFSGMHYLAMAAMIMSPGLMPSMSGSTGTSFVFPLVLGISLVTVILTLAISLSPTEDEIKAEALLKRRFESGLRADSRRTAPSLPEALAAPESGAQPQAPISASPTASARRAAAHAGPPRLFTQRVERAFRRATRQPGE
jgi:NO-binding membrane sensor protein with MHYT domain